MKFLKIILLTTVLLFSPMIHLQAAVTQHTADSIASLLNGKVPPGCDASCSLYTSEHPGLGLTNTIFIALLVVIGSIWMYTSYYKKKYILVVGTLVGLLMVGSYFAAPLLRRGDAIPDSCPVLKPDKANPAKAAEFTTPGNEFESSGTDSSKSIADTARSTAFSPASSDEFKGTQQDEFKSEGDEFQAATDSKTAIATVQPAANSIQLNLLYEPLGIFIILAIISLFIKYPGFRKFKGYFLLAGLVYFGFYRGACPCMISGFQNGILMIFGVPLKWESALWFLVLVPATYLFGRVWCGWLCHLGALQEFIYKGEKMDLLKTRKSQQILKIAQISLFIIWMLQLIISKTNIYCSIDPFKTAFNLFSATTTGWVLLGILLLSSVLIYRPFCRTICPVGLILGWISYIPGARKLHKNDSCVHCKSCSNSCHYHAMIFENKTTTLNNEDCIMCGECISSCKKDALKINRKKAIKKIIPILLLLICTSQAQAQWECPSRLGANLKPIGDSNLMWATEITSSAGTAGGVGMGNLMVFGALDYTSGKNNFYLEGGLKNWARFSSTETNSHLLLLGLREAYYKYNGDNQNLTVGLQSMKSDDDYLLNERVAGVSYKVNTGNFGITLSGGSVLKEFARNGTFCTVGYLYDIVYGRERSVLGNQFGQTNLAMMTLSYSPGKKNASDEFAGSDDGLSTPKNSLLKLNSLGALAYREFGDWIINRPLLTGLYAHAEVAGISLKPELLLQTATNNKALIYSLYADKQLEWQNGQMTRAFIRYIGLKAIDDQATAQNSFSNIFAGEVLRFDGLDMPFLQVGIKHSFTNTKTSLKLQYAMQTGTPKAYISDDFNSTPSRMKELDLSLSKNFGKHFLLTGYVGYLWYPSLDNTTGYLMYTPHASPWGKIELRYTF